MANTRTKWTKEEDEILVQAIKANPHNKSQAFREASDRIGKNISSCSNRWYKVLSNPKSKSYRGCIFTMVGVSSKLDNRTINRKKVHIKPERIKKGLWEKIKNLLGLK